VNTTSFREELLPQIPALRLLMALGYRYLTPSKALACGATASGLCCWRACWPRAEDW